jgi:hypothetical protein
LQAHRGEPAHRQNGHEVPQDGRILVKYPSTSDESIRVLSAGLDRGEAYQKRCAGSTKSRMVDGGRVRGERFLTYVIRRS